MTTTPEAEATMAERTVDTTKLNAGQLVQRIMRSMDSTSVPGSTAELAEQIAADILDLPPNYWSRPAPAAEVTGEREAWITECCKHIKICADVWELSGVSRVRTITKAADDILKALTTPSPDAGRVPEVVLKALRHAKIDYPPMITYIGNRDGTPYGLLQTQKLIDEALAALAASPAHDEVKS